MVTKMKNSMAMDLKDSPCPVASQTNPISRFHPLLKSKGNQKIEKRRLVESCCQLSFVIWITWILYIYWLHSYNMKKKLAIMLFFALPVKIYHSQRKVSLISFKWSKPDTSITTMLIKTGPLHYDDVNQDRSLESKYHRNFSFQKFDLIR